MNPYKPAFFVVLAAFFVAMALAWWRGFDDGPSQGRRASDGARLEAPGDGPPVDDQATGGAGGTACSNDAELRAARGRLEACEHARWTAVRDAIRKDVESRAVLRDAGPATREASDFEQQQRALCEVARAGLDELLKRDKEFLLQTLAPVGTGPWVDQWITDRLAIQGEMFDLSSSDRTALENDYRSLWAGHGEKLQALLDEPVVDFSAVVTDVRALWREEDALLGSRLGPDAVSQYRIAELKPRTTILALLATLAGMPLDQSTAW
jgi:hypothetical protein